MKIKEAIAEIGCDLSKPSKMPGYGYSLPAHACLTGSKLAQIPGTPCHKCYAMRGNYLYTRVTLPQPWCQILPLVRLRRPSIHRHAVSYHCRMQTHARHRPLATHSRTRIRTTVQRRHPIEPVHSHQHHESGFTPSRQPEAQCPNVNHQPQRRVPMQSKRPWKLVRPMPRLLGAYHPQCQLPTALTLQAPTPHGGSWQDSNKPQLPKNSSHVVILDLTGEST